MTDRETAKEFEGDTSLESLRVQMAALRRMSVQDRLRMMDHLTELARSMTIEGIRRRHPDATEAEIEFRFSELVLGKDLAARVRAHRLARTASQEP